MIAPLRVLCPVCCLQYPLQDLHSISNCPHKYCKMCCIQHIQARLASFQSISCLDHRCSKPLHKNSQLYSQLSSDIKIKIGKYQQYQRIQNDRGLKPCNNEECLGVIRIKNNNQPIQCSQCKAKHCPGCFGLSHGNSKLCRQNNKVNQQNEDETMQKLHFRKCPNCSVWVERNGGCQYLKCKCKTQFCFVCGQKFENDPCRKQQLIGNEKTIRGFNKQIWTNIKTPQSVKQALLFGPRLVLKIVLMLIFTSLSGIVLMGLAFGLLIPLLYLISPAVLIVLYGEMQLTNTRAFLLRLATVILYPVVGLVVSVAMFFILATYPFMRIVYPTHFYDQIDRFMASLTIVYLQGINCILKI